MWHRTPPDSRIERVLTAIEQDVAYPWKNQELADLTHMATNAFARIFRNTMGTTLQQYIATRRVNQAHVLLEHTDDRLDEIAERCGFCFRSHLSTRFRQQLQVGPATYRRSLRETYARAL